MLRSFVVLRAAAAVAPRAACVAVRHASTQAGQTLGFIGLGQMGAHMARNLLKHGHQVVVYDASSEAMAAFEESAKKIGAGKAVLGRDPADVAKHIPSDGAIVTMLPSPPHVKKVYSDSAQGILAHAHPGVLLIDSSTIDPDTSRLVAHDSVAKNCAAVDAPVSGGILGAEAGTLTFMVGGSKENFDRARPVLAKMGKNIVHCGANGNGQVAKICNNLLLGISMAGTAEAMLLGERLGMDPKLLASIINTSSGRCWSSEVYNPCPGVMENVPSSRGYTGGFGVSLMAKDLGLAVAAGQSSSTPMPLGELAERIYKEIPNHGAEFAGKDFSVVFKWLDSLKSKNQ